MFICAVTGKVSKPREPMLHVVVETRPVTYINRTADGEEIISKGWEIVKEIGVTKAGLEAWQAKHIPVVQKEAVVRQGVTLKAAPKREDDEGEDDA